MEITSYKQAAKFVNETITAPSVKRFLFGAEEVEHYDLQGIGTINKLLTVEFLLIYCKWINSSRHALHAYKSYHFCRAEEVMRTLYKGRKLSLDMITFVLSEGQEDIFACGERSFFYPLMNAEAHCKFSKIYSLIDDWRTDLQTSTPPLLVVLRYFISALQACRALTTAEVVSQRTDAGYVTEFVLDGEPLHTWNIVHTATDGTRYVLVDKDYDGEDMLYRYMALDDLSRITVIKKADRR